MARKGQFKKGGGRVGGGGGGKSRKRSGSTGGALVVMAPARRAPARRTKAAAPKRRTSSRRRAASGQGMSLGKVVATGLVLGSACETNNGPLGPTIYNVIQKIPGAKTFGGAATAGMALGALHEFTSLGGPTIRPFLKIAGILGLGLAAIKVGITGQAFKWVGDAGDDSIMSVE